MLVNPKRCSVGHLPQKNVCLFLCFLNVLVIGFGRTLTFVCSRFDLSGQRSCGEGL